MKKVVIVFFCFFCLLSLYSQKATLTGMVYDQHSGESLAGANVRINGTYTGAFTSPGGSFSLQTKASFPLTLVVSFIGYEPDTLVLEEEPQKPIRIDLVPSVVVSDEIVISAIRLGGQDAPAFSNVGAAEIERLNTGTDLPVMLDASPSVTSSSDAGAGVGYTAFRLRGTDQSRINVTINGVPYNDPESHNVYWVDVSDLASSSDNIQIQRGVGSSTNGASSFGGSINISTLNYKPNPFASLLFRGGSFGTAGSTVLFGTGLLNGQWTIDGRASILHSDGFIDRASSDLQSLQTNVVWYREKTIFRFLAMHGKEKTYQAWNGVPSVRLNNDSAGMQLYADHWLYSQQQVDEMMASDSRTYNLYTYKNQVDQYTQNHYHLVMSNQHSKSWSSSATLFLITGNGYYEEYKYDEPFSDYLLPAVVVGLDTLGTTNLVRRRCMDNAFYGTVLSANYDNRKNIHISLGGNVSRYEGDHFGKVIWRQYAADNNTDHEYYRNHGVKDDFSVFAKIRLAATRNTSVSGEFQLRQVQYVVEGDESDKKGLNIDATYRFYNPKISIVHTQGRNTLYGYFGIAGREPNRYMMVDADSNKIPSPETLFDLEAGIQHKADRWNAQINLYGMFYRDQLVQTGEINDIGSPVYVNVDKSYRAGIEGIWEWNILKRFTWSGNVTLSVNKITNDTLFVEDWDLGILAAEYYKSTDISFSPGCIGSMSFMYSPKDNIRFTLVGKYVGRQYIDNSSSEERMLDAYKVFDLNAEYLIKPHCFKECIFRLTLRNIFSEEYESNAWVYRYYYGGKHYVMDGYFPQAKINWLASVLIKF